MEAKDLMIGDWVKIPNTKVEHEFWRIGLDLMQGIEDGIIEPEPIPLTLEILEKNGFEYVESWNEFWHRADGTGESDFQLAIEGGDFIISGVVNARIRYVHQLQHALKLCGIEKEIEL